MNQNLGPINVWPIISEVNRLEFELKMIKKLAILGKSIKRKIKIERILKWI